MNTMKRLSLAVPVLLGGLLLASCDPYGGPPGYTGPSTYGYAPNAPYPSAPGPGPTRGDGYTDPSPPNGGYGYNDPNGNGNGAGNGSGDGDSGTYIPDDGHGARNTPPPPRNTPPSSGTGKADHPVAEKTKNPNQVLSPYEPYNVIDVTGFKSGQLAKDPSNGKIFRVP